MPKLLDWNGWRFFFYSREGMPLEPPHVHIRKDGSEVKVWLTPVVRVADERRMDARTLKMLVAKVELERDRFEERWHDFFSRAR